MKRRLVRFKNELFLLLCLVIAVLMVSNEMAQQYTTTHPVIRHRRAFNRAAERIRSRIQSHGDEGHDDVILNESLRHETRTLSSNGSTSAKNEFDHWNEMNPNKLAIFIFSAVTSPMVNKNNMQVIILNGWVALRSKTTPIKCCFTWSNGRTTFYTHPRKTYNNNRRIPIVLFAVQFYCPIHGNASDVTGVTLQNMQKKCPDRGRSVYVKPTLAFRAEKTESLALCGKIFYGDLDEKLIVDWVEYYRLMKVDKILLYKHNLTRKAERVIDYYASTGFLEVGKFDIPMKTGTREVGTKNPEAWNDEEVAVFDCFERLKDYTYFVIVDLDEFLLPRNHTDLKDMIGYLRNENPKAAGFTFKSNLYLKEWDKAVVNNGSDIVQYFDRTGVVFTRQKNVVIPPRVIQGTIHTHTYKAKEGFERIVVHPRIGIINHYRYSCYENYLKQCAHSRRTRDRTIMKFVKRITKQTSEVLKQVT